MLLGGPRVAGDRGDAGCAEPPLRKRSLLAPIGTVITGKKIEEETPCN